MTLLLLASDPAAADEQAAWMCRAQVLVTCTTGCVADEMMPADLDMDFAAKTGDFCRGESCSSGKLRFRDTKGQWDGRPYRVFSLIAEGEKTVMASGVIDMTSRTFFAENTDVPTLFGRCE